MSNFFARAAIVIGAMAIVGVATWELVALLRHEAPIVDLPSTGSALDAQSLSGTDSLRASHDAEGLAAAGAYLARRSETSLQVQAKPQDAEPQPSLQERFPFEIGKPIPTPAIGINLSMLQSDGKGFLRAISREPVVDQVNPLRIPLSHEDAARLAELVKPEAMLYLGTKSRMNLLRQELLERTPADGERFDTFQAAQEYCKTKYGGAMDGAIRGTETGYYVVVLAPSEETLPLYLAKAELNAHAAVVVDRLRFFIDTGEYKRR